MQKPANIKARQPIGSTGVDIPRICFGTSALGSMPDTYSYAVDERRAVDTVIAILNSDMPFLDCSRLYGMGKSEQRIGLAIRELGGLPSDAVISTKLDRNVETGLFDAAQARQSVEESLEALGLDSLDILHLHDPEHAASLEPITKSNGAIDELHKMREEGLCRAVGLAAGDVEVMKSILHEHEFDCLITHNRHTLVNANARSLIALAVTKDISVLNAAPYCGGALAKGSASFKRYVYQDANDEMLAPIKAVEAVCGKYDIPPGAAALQFSLHDVDIDSTICGVSKPERLVQTLEWASFEIPDAAWKELLAIPRTEDDPEATRDYSPG